MNIEYSPKYKRLIEDIKIEFLTEGINPPQRLLTSCAMPSSNPREIFLIRVCSILLSRLNDLKSTFKSNSDIIIKLENLYNKYDEELKGR
jgi:hypothetical protein